MLSVHLGIFIRCQDNIWPKSWDSHFLRKYDVTLDVHALDISKALLEKPSPFLWLSRQGGSRSHAWPYQLEAD